MSDDEQIIVGAVNLSKLLEDYKPFKIPFFQRSYVWRKKEWDRFLDNVEYISEENKNYLMGAIILKIENMGAGVVKRFVIDGQQRLTTLLIFLRCKGEAKFLFDKKQKPILEHSHIDKDIFEEVINDDLEETMLANYPRGKKNQKDKRNQIIQCYEYFNNKKNTKRIADIDANKVLERMRFVVISLSHEDDEQQIFNTMNSHGIPLENSELLKNALYSEGEKDRELYENTWKESFEKDEKQKIFWDTKFGTGGSQKTHMDMLLQSYIIAKGYGDNSGGYVATDRLFKGYRTALALIDESRIDKEIFIKGLTGYAETYKEKINEKDKEGRISSKNVIQRLNVVLFGLNITTAVPYVIYVLKEVKDEKEREKILKFIEAYLVRRVIVKASNKDYRKDFLGHIQNKRVTYKALRESIDSSNRTLMPNNEQLEQAFISKSPPGATAKVNTKAKFILYFLEQYARSSKLSMSLRPTSEYSVEHVMPIEWKTHWSKGFPKNDFEKITERDKLILTFGNLTLLTHKLNSDIGNASWEDKKKGVPDGKGSYSEGLNDCCKDVATFSKYLEKDVWNEDVIKERSKELFNWAKDLWPYDPPTS